MGRLSIPSESYPMSPQELCALPFPRAALARCFTTKQDRDQYAWLCKAMPLAPPMMTFERARRSARGPVLTDASRSG